MEMGFQVRLISPARNALLLLESSHESVPGMNVAYSARPYSSAAIVSLESITTRLFASTRLAPWLHSSHWHQEWSPSPLPSGSPTGVPRAFNAWHRLRKPAISRGISL